MVTQKEDEMNQENPSFIDKFNDSLSSGNDGSSGKYRAPAEFNATGVNTDKEAVALFLDQYRPTPTTLRTYSKECERFHMWAVLWLNKSIADMSMEDFQHYMEFVANPSPEWTSDKKLAKSNPDWRPFASLRNTDGKVIKDTERSENAVKVAVAAVNSMMTWMVEAGYLSVNALGILRQRNKKVSTGRSEDAAIKKVDRFLDDEMWDACIRYIENMDKSEPKELIMYERIRFIMIMFSMVGSRVSEMSNALMRDFVRGRIGWFWYVKGKGSKTADVAIPDDMMPELMRWRTALGLSSLPSSSEKIPVIPMINKSGHAVYKKLNGEPRFGLSDRRISSIIKTVFQKASRDPLLSKDRRDLLKTASVHWLRHTSITQKVDSGMDRFKVQKDARHSDIKTTLGYTHDEEISRSAEAQKHKLKWTN